ncbi:MAG: 50S ribosomal protein L25/general stress protein Ctc [Hyphomonadaceae bacterium]
MAGIVLNVEQRARTGSGAARAVRKADQLPGVLYGGPRGAVAITLEKAQVLKALRAGKFISHMIEIDHKGERQPVIPRAIQYHPVSDMPIHVDLYRIEENSVIDVEVPVHFKNHEASPGLKRGGALNIVSHTVRLRVPASKIPEELVIDLTGREIGEVFHLSALTLPPGATPSIRDRDFTIATISGRHAEEEAAPTAAAAEAAPAADKKAE